MPIEREKAPSMTMRRGLLVLSLLAASVLLAGPAVGQVVDLQLTVSNGVGDAQELGFGLDPGATVGIDPELGEAELPPFPPSAVFEARFVGEDIEVPELGLGSYRDYRPGSVDFEGDVVHQIKFQEGEGDDVTIAWAFPEGVTGRLRDVITGTIVDEEMAGTGSYTVLSGINELEFTATYVSNRPPDATDGSYDVDEDGGLSASPEDGVLADDTDPDGDPLTASLVTDVSVGDLALAADGSFTYTPPADYFGDVTFTYAADDGEGGTDTAEVTIQVHPVNDAPTFSLLGNQTVTSGAGPQTVPGFAFGIDEGGGGGEDGQEVTFDVATDDESLFQVQPAIASDGTLTYTPSGEVGSATITVTAMDDGGTANGGDDTSGPQTRSITITSDQPVIESLTGDTSGDEGDSYGFAATATDPGGDALTYTWDFGDGTEESGIDLTSVSHTYADDGTYTLMLTVDDGSESDSESLAVSVTNVSPTITDLGGDTTGSPEESLSFAASASDPGGADDPLTYTWDFGDGSPTESGVGLTSVSHVYADEGDYTLTLTVTDDDGGSDSATLDIIVSIDPPIVDPIAGDFEGAEGDTFCFEGSATDPNGDVLVYTWDFGDGSPTESGVALTNVCHLYGSDGVYTLTLTVEDDDGNAASVSESVDVMNAPPVITNLEGDTEGDEGATFSYTASASDPGGDPLEYWWDFGDGSQVVSGTGLTSVEHTYEDEGSYTLTLTVDDVQSATVATIEGVSGRASPRPSEQRGAAAAGFVARRGDGSGGSDQLLDSATLTVEVVNVPPTVESITYEPTGGGSVELAAVVTDPGEDVLVYTWDFGDGSEPMSGVDLSEVSHVYEEEGTYTVSLVVDDGDGGTGTGMVEVEVAIDVCPVAGDDAVETDEDTEVVIVVLDNDTCENGTLTVEGVTVVPDSGTATINPDGTISYVPDADFNGEDSFAYEVSDGSGTTDEATVSVTVLPVSDAPTASSIEAPADGSTIDLAAADSVTVSWTASTDADGDDVSYRWEAALDEGDFDPGLEDREASGTSLVIPTSELIALLTGEGVPAGGDTLVYHRVVATDGSLETAGPVVEVTFVLPVINNAEAGTSLPEAFALGGAYPNPVTRSAQISFDLPEPCGVVVEVYDVLGRRVSRLDYGVVAAGAGREVSVDAARLRSGAYVYRLAATGARATQVESGRLTVIR